MRKVLMLMLVILMAFVVVGCSGKNDEGKGGNNVTKEPVPTGSFKVLSIGNSFSEDAHAYLYNIAKELGKTDIIVANLYIGGCSISTHYTNAGNNGKNYTFQLYDASGRKDTASYSIRDGLEYTDWDWVSIQQVSQDSGRAETYNDRQLSYLTNYVVDNCNNKNVRVGWHATWAYQQNSTHGGFTNYGKSQSTMYSSIVDATKNSIASREDMEFIVPNTTVVQNARTSYLGDNLTRDGYHLNLDEGRFFAGLGFYKAVTGESIDGILNSSQYTAKFSSDIKKIAIESVNNAIAKPYEITESEYKAKTIDFDSLELATVEWQKESYWNSNAKDTYANITTGDTTSKSFIATKNRFNRDTLPVGSVIVLKEGYQYRPDAWLGDMQTEERPGNVSTPIIEITNEWWGDYIYRAFNLSNVSTTETKVNDLVDVSDVFKLYLPKEFNYTPDFDVTKYDILDIDWELGAYWNSNNGIIATKEDNDFCRTFASSVQRFTKTQIPVGSKIVLISSNWQYRPDGWITEEKVTGTKPNNVADTGVIDVTNDWWGDYTKRGFNLSRTDTSTSAVLRNVANYADALNSVFVIYVPKV